MNRAKNVMMIIVAACLIFSMSSLAIAAEKGGPAEAKALLAKAVKLINEKGDKAYPEIHKANGTFVIDENVYVYVFTADTAEVKAHPTNPKMLGNKYPKLPFVAKIMEMSKTKTTGNIEYKWSNPKTKKLDDKFAYYEKVPSQNVIAVCGYYK